MPFTLPATIYIGSSILPTYTHSQLLTPLGAATLLQLTPHLVPSSFSLLPSSRPQGQTIIPGILSLTAALFLTTRTDNHSWDLVPDLTVVDPMPVSL